MYPFSREVAVRLAKLYLVAACDLIYDKFCSGRQFRDVPELRSFLGRRLRDGVDLLMVQVIEHEVRMLVISNKLEHPVVQPEIRLYTDSCKPLQKILHNYQNLHKIIEDFLVVMYRMRRDPELREAELTMSQIYASVLPDLEERFFGPLLPEATPAPNGQ
jgi:hypothetical protein